MEVAFLALFGSKMQIMSKCKVSSVFQIVKLWCYARYFTHIVKRHLLALKYGNTLGKAWSAAMFFLTSCCLKTILGNLNASHSLTLERIHFYDMIHAASTLLFFLTFFKKKKKVFAVVRDNDFTNKTPALKITGSSRQHSCTGADREPQYAKRPVVGQFWNGFCTLTCALNKPSSLRRALPAPACGSH